MVSFLPKGLKGVGDEYIRELTDDLSMMSGEQRRLCGVFSDVLRMCFGGLLCKRRIDRVQVVEIPYAEVNDACAFRMSPLARNPIAIRGLFDGNRIAPPTQPNHSVKSNRQAGSSSRPFVKETPSECSRRNFREISDPVVWPENPPRVRSLRITR